MMYLESILDVIQTYEPVTLPETEQASAVMILIVSDGASFSLALTKRSDTVDYAGDFCFPGGQKEKTDVDYLATAKRELFEELHIAEQYYQVIGSLDDFMDKLDNRVTPFVATIDKQDFEAQCLPASDEVALVYLLPLDDVKRFDTSEELERVSGRHPSYYYINDNAHVWGLTASMIVQLGNIIFKLQKPVAKQKSRLD